MGPSLMGRIVAAGAPAARAGGDEILGT
jgi:hypothetical protein